MWIHSDHSVVAIFSLFSCHSISVLQDSFLWYIQLDNEWCHYNKIRIEIFYLDMNMNCQVFHSLSLTWLLILEIVSAPPIMSTLWKTNIICICITRQLVLTLPSNWVALLHKPIASIAMVKIISHKLGLAVIIMSTNYIYNNMK